MNDWIRSFTLTQGYQTKENTSVQNTEDVKASLKHPTGLEEKKNTDRHLILIIYYNLLLCYG